MRWLLLFSWLAIFFAPTSIPQEQYRHMSVLHVEAFTSIGERIDKIYVVVAALSGTASYKGAGRDVKLSLPTGPYTMTVQAAGFRTTQQSVNIYGVSVLKTVLLPVAVLHGQASPILSGRVVGMPGKPADIRVRLVPMFGTELEEGHPDNSGRFSFQPDLGPYILMTVIDSESGPRIADWRQLTVTGIEEVIIDLSKTAGRTP